MIKYALRSKPTEKLVELAQSGLTEAMDLIIEKFYPMVVRIASQFYAPWAEFDDIVQNGLIGLIKAIFYYEPGKSSFSTFAWRSIESEVKTFITYQNRKKNKMLSDSTSMDSIFDDVDDEQIDYFVADTSTTTNVVRNTILSIVHEEILESLKEDEIKIFELWLDGYSYKEIEEQVGVNFKKVDNTIQKVKRIIRSRLSASILPFLEG
ncbi:sigma-70 family RNA polymerase sigma factor [Fervidobacterium pennivorans subsp. shakshaketiis]|jgi:RNA polymerase sporulation-specific sigma factor|uniref:RNA polymerase sigma70 factor n=2 Tax=Fervidobacterium pennivorans TaxID=93466 RepID=A0A172T328_FERPE|nr:MULTISPECIES: sigma-70 family RNA polymerase sigma factor [Fervidobacterium]AFG34436.1 RNA polymerase, sigma 30 subunit, SigH [Fervidobacterium pennivorans DSM 9078]ANE41418.1 RNA polymerase sigma70 factor [Fervidobacterium pennivorans]MDM7321455.1 sigma-70 family RNA polymerase sigma factor [Fervidobacterium sp.]NPU89312.1 sigma-70 family RNA polymerase sigma factor [Fervidobacterium sp.]QIV77780.1 sigma-70 family RNA polymerase sigma factor [Fervidobacterium pennivorans subsp. keratinolyt